VRFRDRLLVYASGYEEGKGWTGACGRTRRVSEGKKDKRELSRNGQKAKI
jgi:hypothetical protein